METKLKRLADNDPKLKSVDLEAYELGPEGAKKVAEAIVNNTHCTRLILEDNQLGDEGAAAFAEVLKRNGTLKTLHLGNNDISATGAELIGQALTSNATLTYLNLEGNKFGEVGAKKLAAVLDGQGIHLNRLYIGYNGVGEYGAHAFVKVLKSNPKLTTLDFGDDKFPEDLTRLLVTLVNKNKDAFSS